MQDPRFHILAINPGSGSTKIGIFDDALERWSETIRHGDAELRAFMAQPIAAQLDFRYQKLRGLLLEKLGTYNDVAAVVGRGGLLRPLAGGTYEVNNRMRDDLFRAERGDHASNLGALLARAVAQEIGCPAFIVDPVSVDEWPPVARLSGLAGLDRECLWHALNSRAIALRFADEQQRAYADLRLIVAHLGSGISVSAHAGGKMIDVTNSREEGAFSTERAGGLPVMKLIEWCLSGTADRATMERRIFREGGIFSYLGTRDLREVMQRVESGDTQAATVLDAMIYQIAKEIGAMAAVQHGRVDGILLTGGMAHETRLCEMIEKRVGWIAAVHRYPGEDELAALAGGALRVLRGEETPKAY